MFTQAAGPFQGLTATDLAVKNRKKITVLRTIPGAVESGGRPRRRRKDGLSKGKESMTKATDMVGRLRQSVAEIISSDAPDKEELLNKSFDEFEEAVAEIEDDEVLDEGEYEQEDDGDIDPVVAFADALAHADEVAAALIEAGAIDENTAALIDHWSAVSDVALRAMANTRAEPIFDDEAFEAAKADGAGLYEMALAKSDDAEDDEPEAVMVKTDLPEQVAQFITDPEDLAARMADIGLSIANFGGVPVDEMLAKFDPEAEGMGPEMGGDPAGLAQAIQVLMRLNAAALVQGEQVMRQLSGDMPDDDGEGAPEEEVAEDEGYEGEEGEEEPSEEEMMAEEGEEEAPEEAEEDEEDPRFARKSASSSELKKVADAAVAEAVGPLQKALADARAELDRMKSQPTAPKGALSAVSKSADNGKPDEDQLKKIAELPEQDRSVALMKLVHQNPIPV